MDRPKRKIQKPKRYKTTSTDDDDNPKETMNSTAIGTEIEDIKAELRTYESSKTLTSTLQDTMNTHDNVPAECERNAPEVHVQQSRDIQTQNIPNIMYSLAESTHFYSTSNTHNPYTQHMTPANNQIVNRISATPYLPQQNNNSYTQMLHPTEYTTPNYSALRERNNNQPYFSGTHNTTNPPINYYESHIHYVPQSAVVQPLSSPTVTASNNELYLNIAPTSETGKPTISTSLHSATTTHSTKVDTITQVNMKPTITSNIVLQKKPLMEMQSTALQQSKIDDLLTYVNTKFSIYCRKFYFPLVT